MTGRAAAPHPLTPLEIASGVVVGADPGTPPLPESDGHSPRATLEAAILPALLRPPCVVSFSGGRDSSAMLALAVHVARREGLAPPVPLTIRYPQAPDTFEDEWQQLVLRQLGIEDWQRLEITDELDIIGPHARAALRAHGVLFPANAYTYLPMYPLAAGGTLVTGLDGDGLLAGWSCEAAVDVLAGRRFPQPRDVLKLGMYAGPQRVRQAVWARRLRRDDSWLTPDAEESSRRAEAREMAEEPMRWDRRVAWWHARRYLSLTQHFDDVLGGAADVVLSHPLLDSHFLSAIARLGGRHGPGDRTSVMRLLVADLLPEAVLARKTKATFDAPFFNRHTREFAERWDGGGVDTSLVEPALLRAAWLRSRPPIGSAIMLQAAWLATEG